MRSEAAEIALAGYASKSTYAGAAMSIGGWMLSSEFAVLSGSLFALVGVIVNTYYKHRADKRAERLHALREQYIRGRRQTDTDLGDLGEDD